MSLWEEWETQQRFPSPGEIAPAGEGTGDPVAAGAAISPGRRFPRAPDGIRADQAEAPGNEGRTGRRPPAGIARRRTLAGGDEPPRGVLFFGPRCDGETVLLARIAEEARGRGIRAPNPPVSALRDPEALRQELRESAGLTGTRLRGAVSTATKTCSGLSRASSSPTASGQTKAKPAPPPDHVVTHFRP